MQLHQRFQTSALRNPSVDRIHRAAVHCPCTAAAQAVLEKAGVDAKAAYAMVSIFPLRSDILKLTQISEKAAEEAQKAAEAALKRDEKAAEAAQKRDEKAADAAQKAVEAAQKAAEAAQKQGGRMFYAMIFLAIMGGILNASGDTLMTKIIR